MAVTPMKVKDSAYAHVLLSHRKRELPTMIATYTSEPFFTRLAISVPRILPTMMATMHLASVEIKHCNITHEQFTGKLYYQVHAYFWTLCAICTKISLELMVTVYF